MNKYSALLATIIVTNSFGGTKIHASNSDIEQAVSSSNTSCISHTEDLPETLLYPLTNNDEITEEWPNAATSIFTSVSGAAIRIDPFISVSKITSKVDSFTTIPKTIAKPKPLTSVSETTATIEPFFSVSGTAIELKSITAMQEAATEFRYSPSTSGPALETTTSDITTDNMKNSSAKQPEETQKNSKKAKKIKYIKMEVPEHNNFKSYMSYRAITCKASKQYELQQKATTGEFGIRIVNGRYLIAMGTYYTENIGDKFNITLSDGTILKCMIGDLKADKDTDPKKQKQKYDGSIIEFITDPNEMPSNVKRAGSYSVCEKFSGSIKTIKKVK